MYASLVTDLFEHAASEAQGASAPLAERLRPKNLDEVVGQTDLIGDGAPLRKLIELDLIPSLVFWGPPGSGKTTLAKVIAHHTQANFVMFSAMLSGVKDLRSVVDQAKKDFQYSRQKTILFIDEIHRFNKAQQDALLPHIEAGTILFIGATTENPSFSVISPLLSRSRVFVLKALQTKDLQLLLQKGLKTLNKDIEEKASELLLSISDGDARRLLNTLEIASNLAKKNLIALSDVSQAAQKKILLYDKAGEEHYNVISAFIKSMRASDPDAAIYYLARMYEAGEDPLFIARRMVIFASEDIGLADPQALPLAISAMQAYDFVGLAEGWIPLAHAVAYLARATKSNASYQAYKNAKAEVETTGPLPVPLHLRNAPTKLMKDLDYGKDYKYAHSDPEGSKDMTCLPEEIKGKIFFKKE